MFKRAPLRGLPTLCVTLALFALVACGAPRGAGGQVPLEQVGLAATPRASVAPTEVRTPTRGAPRSPTIVPATAADPTRPAGATPEPVREQDPPPATGEERAIVLDLAQQLWPGVGRHGACGAG